VHTGKLINRLDLEDDLPRDQELDSSGANDLATVNHLDFVLS